MKTLILYFLISITLIHGADTFDWAKSTSGIAIAVVVPPNQTTLTQLEFYLENQGDKEILGVIQADSCCVLEINGQFYATNDMGGKSSYMPPGKRYGPISIKLPRFYKIPKLEFHSVNPEKPAFYEPPQDATAIRVYYKLSSPRSTEAVFVKSNEIRIPNI